MEKFNLSGKIYEYISVYTMIYAFSTLSYTYSR